MSVVNINEEIHFQIKLLSAENKKSMKELIEEAISDLLKKYKEENKNGSDGNTNS